MAQKVLGCQRHFQLPSNSSVDDSLSPSLRTGGSCVTRGAASQEWLRRGRAGGMSLRHAFGAVMQDQVSGSHHPPMKGWCSETISHNAVE